MKKIQEDLLEKITYGFYVVTTRMDSEELATREKDYIAAATVSWLMQNSFEPPMVTIAIRKGSDLNETIGRAGVFAVNILGKDHESLVDAFAGNTEVRGQKLNGFPFLNGVETNCPVLDHCIGYLECQVIKQLDTAGDHTLFVGRVVNSQTHHPEALPLHEWETGKHYGGKVRS